MLWMAFKRVVVETWAVCGPPEREPPGDSEAMENMDIRFAMFDRGKASEASDVLGGQPPTVYTRCSAVDGPVSS